MPSSRIPSPARSQGAKLTPRRYKPRASRSVGSPARSNTSVKLSAVVQMDSFVLSPMSNRQSVLTDTTDIDIPRRKSWWKKLDENSREIMDVLHNNEPMEANNAIEEYIEVDVLSQEKKNYTLDLPESSDGESISSIVIPQRKLFTQKESQPQKKYRQIMDNRESLAKLHKSQTVDERPLNVGPKNLFNQGTKQRNKPIFPAALLNISANKTLANKTKELPSNEVKGQVKTLFGNRPATKRKNMFADFVVSESEDEISEIQPKVFGFQKKVEHKNVNSHHRRESSPTSSVTDTDMDDWRLLPSSTMVDHQLEDGLKTTPSKRARLSKLSEVVESVNTTANKTKQSNKTLNSKSRSKNASKFKEMEQNELISPMTNDDELDDANHHENNSKDKSVLEENTSKKNVSHERTLRKSPRNKEHSKAKNTSQLKPVHEDATTEETLNNKDNRHNKSKQNKTSNTLSKIDQALQVDDDEDFTLEYENDDEVGEGNIKNKTVENVVQNTNLNNVKNTSNSANTSKSRKIQNKSKTIIQPEGSNKDKSVEKQNETNSNERAKNVSSENIEGNEHAHNNDVKRQNPDTSNNKNLNSPNNLYNNLSNRNIEHQETCNVENKDMEIEQNLISNKSTNCEIIENEYNNSKSNKVVNYDEGNEHENLNQEDGVDDEILDEDQPASHDIEDEEQNKSENDKDDAEHQDEVQSNHQVDDSSDNEEIQDNSQDNINHEEIEDQNEAEIVEEDQDDVENANVTDDNQINVDNNDESQKGEDNNEEDNEEEGNNGDDSSDIQAEEINGDINHESEEEIDDEREEEMEESDQSANQEIESDEEEVQDDQDTSEAENDKEDQNISDHAEDVEDEENESNDNEEIQESHEVDMEQSDIQNESRDEVDNENVNNDNEDDEDDDNNQFQSYEEGIEKNTIEEAEPNKTHDTTGRHRRKHNDEVPSPEIPLHDKTNQMESFTIRGRNTSVRKTKSMVKKHSPSLAPLRESTGFSDGAKDSSAEGSGWDSHRTTRLTLRQTLGRDFTPRKSLRALVMEKSAKRQTNFTEINDISKMPQANSTEVPRQDSFDMEDDFDEQETPESDHEMSRKLRQTTLEMYLQKVKEQNIKRKKQLEDEIRSRLEAPTRDVLNPFKIPAVPKRRMQHGKENKPKAKVMKSVIPLNMLPTEVLEDMQYKPPKRYRPASASWITKRLYKYLETKLEPKYDYRARVRAEKLVETIYNFTKETRRVARAPPPAVDALKKEMARLNIVSTHVEFYEFFHEYMPREVRVKVVPDVFNKISLPKHGVFSEILR